MHAYLKLISYFPVSINQPRARILPFDEVEAKKMYHILEVHFLIDGTPLLGGSRGSVHIMHMANFLAYLVPDHTTIFNGHIRLNTFI